MITITTAADELTAANEAAKAAHLAYLDAKCAASRAVYEVAVGDKPTSYLYEVLFNLNRAVEEHASACWKQGSASSRNIYGRGL